MKRHNACILLISTLLADGVVAQSPSWYSGSDTVVALSPSWHSGSDTNDSVLAHKLRMLLNAPVLTREVVQGLREIPLKTHIAVLAHIDPLSTDMEDYSLATLVLSDISLRCFSRADVPVLSQGIQAIQKRWASLDPGEDPVARTGFRELSEALEFIVPAAQAQVWLAESLEVLTKTTSSVRAIVFNLAGFDPAVRSVDSTIVSLLVSEATPVCDSLLPHRKPLPFSRYWSPDEYAWRDVVLNNAHQAKVLIFLDRDEPLLYVLLLPGELWIGPCGVSPTPIAFSFGPNPPEALYDTLEQIVNHGGKSGDDTDKIQDSKDDETLQLPSQ